MADDRVNLPPGFELEQPSVPAGFVLEAPRLNIAPESYLRTARPDAPLWRKGPINVVSGVMSGVAGAGSSLSSALDKVAVMLDDASTSLGLRVKNRPQFFKQLAKELNSSQQFWDEQLAQGGASGLTKLVAKVAGSLPAGVVEWEMGVPMAGLEGAAEAHAKGENVGVGAVVGGVKRYVLGKALKAAGLIEEAFPRRLAGAGIMGGATAVEGGDLEEALTSAAVGGAMTGRSGKRSPRKIGPVAAENPDVVYNQRRVRAAEEGLVPAEPVKEVPRAEVQTQGRAEVTPIIPTESAISLWKERNVAWNELQAAKAKRIDEGDSPAVQAEIDVAQKRFDAILGKIRPILKAANQKGGSRKPPWELTRQQWELYALADNAYDLQRIKNLEDAVAEGRYGPNAQVQINQAEGPISHARIVEQAVKTGESVPRKILEEYRGQPWADAALTKFTGTVPVVTAAPELPPEAKAGTVEPVTNEVFYRGTVPGDTRRIDEPFESAKGKIFVARKEESAKVYGPSIERIEAKPDAKILHEEDAAFWKLIRRKRPPNGYIGSALRKGESLVDAVNDAVRKAEEAGYDAISFLRDSDIGTIILNESRFVRNAPKESTPTKETVNAEMQRKTQAEGEVTPPVPEPTGAVTAAPVEPLPGEAPFGPSVPTAKPATSSTANATMVAKSAEMGRPVFPEKRYTPDAAIMQEAINSGEIHNVDNKAVSFIVDPKPMTPLETAAFDLRSQQISQEWKALKDIHDKLPEGDANRDGVARKMDDLANLHENLTRATIATGNQSGTAFRLRQGLMEVRDTDPLSAVRKAGVVKKAPLTGAEKKSILDVAGKLADAASKAISRRRKLTGETAVRNRPSRYEKMTLDQKEAEVNQLLGEMNEKNRDQTIKALVENYASRSPQATADTVSAEVAKRVPGETPESIADALDRAAKTRIIVRGSLRDTLAKVRQQFAKNKSLRDQIDNFNTWMSEGTTRPRKDRVYTEADASHDLAIIRDAVKSLYNKSDAVAKERLSRTLAELDRRIENKDYYPIPKTEKPLRDPELEDLEYQVRRRRIQLHRLITQLDPTYKTWYGWISRESRNLQEWQSSLDLSFLMRQGGIMLRSHPIRTLKRLPDALRALTNDKEAFRLNQEIVNGPDSWRYDRFGLEFTDYNGMLNPHEEAFGGDWFARLAQSKSKARYIGKAVEGSNRAFVTFLNLVRKDSFDAMEKAWAKPGGFTLEEGKAVAAFVNVATGRGSFKGIPLVGGQLEKHAATLNGLLWSPKNTISRIQYALGAPLWKAPNWMVRRAVTAEYLRYVGGMAVTYFLYRLAGGELETDPRSSDFGKMRFGNVRLDPLSGLSQTTVFLARQVTGETKRQSGKIVRLGDPKEFASSSRPGDFWRFARSKFGYLPGKVMDVWFGKDFAGQPIDYTEWVPESLMPLSVNISEMLKLLDEAGIPGAPAAQVLQMLGEGVQVYDPAEPTDETTRRQIRRRPL